MKYEVILTKEAKKDLMALEKHQIEKLTSDYLAIQTESMDAVNSRPLGNKLYEIKTNNIRSIFIYKKAKIIVIGVIFTKKTQKTPKQHIEKAIKILTKYKD